MNASHARRSHPARGFSLVELMVVVAIIALLAAIAIPQLMTFTWRAKRAERDVMRSAILLALRTGAHGSSGQLQTLDLPQNPPSSPGVGPAPFSRTLGDWGAIDFAPESPLRYRYTVAYTVAPDSTRALISITGDVDGDGSPSQLDAEYVLSNDTWSEVSVQESLDDW